MSLDIIIVIQTFSVPHAHPLFSVIFWFSGCCWLLLVFNPLMMSATCGARVCDCDYIVIEFSCFAYLTTVKHFNDKRKLC